MSGYIDDFVEALNARSPQTTQRLTQLRALCESIVELADAHDDSDQLGIAANALTELLGAARLFSPWRERPKLTVFGSARVLPDSSLYDMARSLSQRMAERGWMTVSGAGPGIMQAAAQGAGREHTLGVNVDLPFEQSANPYVDAETRLIEMKYFFTRKVALTKESLAFAFFPGGLGTMDEVFEVLTLLHTGKTKPLPVLLLDTEDGRFWEQWRAFMVDAVIADGYLDEQSPCLFQICHSLDDALAAIDRYYSNFVSFKVLNSHAEVVLRHAPTPEQLGTLATAVPSFAYDDGYRCEGTTVSFPFDGRNYVSVRLLIDEMNLWAA